MTKRKPQPYLGIHFKCCNVYTRIYLTKDGKAFAGHCPRCAAAIRVPVAEGGSTDRLWQTE